MRVLYPSVRDAAIQLLTAKPAKNIQPICRSGVSRKVNAARPNTAYAAKATHNLFLDMIRLFSHPSK